MAKGSPYGLSKGDRRRIDRHLDYLGQRRISGSDEATLAGAVRIAAGLRDASSSGVVAIALVPIAIAVLVGAASTDFVLAMWLLAFLFCAGMLSIVVIVSRGQASTAEAARAVVEYRLEVARSARSAPSDQPRRSGWLQRARERRREARADRWVAVGRRKIGPGLNE